MPSSEAMIDSFVRASIGPNATERQRHLAKQSLLAIVRQAISEERAMQVKARIIEDLEHIDRIRHGAH